MQIQIRDEQVRADQHGDHEDQDIPDEPPVAQPATRIEIEGRHPRRLQLVRHFRGRHLPPTEGVPIAIEPLAAGEAKAPGG